MEVEIRENTDSGDSDVVSAIGRRLRDARSCFYAEFTSRQSQMF